MKMLKQLKSLVRSGSNASIESCPPERRRPPQPECQQQREEQLWLKLAA